MADDSGTEEQSVAACQFEPAVGNPDANFDEIEAIVASLDESVAIAVFPESCVTGYDIDAMADLAEPIPGALTEPLEDIARNHGVSVVAGVPERDGDALYNSYVVVDGEGVQAVYRKQYLWGNEADLFASGNGGVTVETPVGTVGLLVCYDVNFPEVALQYIRAECDVLLQGAAWCETYGADWRLLLKARALDGTCYVVGANLRGDQNDRHYQGGSLIANPRGEIVCQAGTDRGAVTASVRPDALEYGRRRNPVLEYRRENGVADEAHLTDEPPSL